MVIFGLSMTALWEPLEYIGEIFVFVGVVGEVLTERKLILKVDEGKRDAVEGVSSWILVAGLAISLSALIGTNEHFNGTIASLNLQAARANERAAALENQAKTDAGNVASLATQASDAKVAQQQVGIELAKQQGRAAKAEKVLLEVQQRFGRQSSPRWAFLWPLGDFMKNKPTGTVEIIFTPEDDEASRTAEWIWSALSIAKWKILNVPHPYTEKDVVPAWRTPAMKDSPFPTTLFELSRWRGGCCCIGGPPAFSTV